MVTCSRALLRVLKEAELLAASEVPVMITGEHGTGKEVLARAMHAASSRAGRPFLRIILPSMGRESIEQELFGPGQQGSSDTSPEPETHLLASCNRGTVFLKGIDTLEPALQGRLVRIIQGEEAGTRLEAAGARLVAASHESLEGSLSARRLSSELVYCIRGSWLHVPPLRERPEDIPLLVDHFLKKNSPPGTEWQIEEAALRTLQSYPFPGNAGELQAVLRSAAKLAQGQVITTECLPEPLRGSPRTRESVPVLPLAAVEEQHIRSVYQQMGRNKVRAARALGVGLNTLRRKLKTYNVK